MRKVYTLFIVLLSLISGNGYGQASMQPDKLMAADSLRDGDKFVGLMKTYTHGQPITADTIFAGKKMFIEYKGAEMADAMRSNGKIYVVIAVLATIFAGIFVYFIMLDRKITKLEKEK